jgi:D-aminoacyl-tRNA deacylase
VRVVLQRVSRAELRVGGELVSRIGHGVVLLVGVETGDTSSDVAIAVDKISGLRVFPDATDKMNLSLQQVGGQVMVVSQFTLVGDVKRGRRPSFTAAAPPEEAATLIDQMVDGFRSAGLDTVTGVFGAKMEVDSVNDGPVTLLFDFRNARLG